MLDESEGAQTVTDARARRRTRLAALGLALGSLILVGCVPATGERTAPVAQTVATTPPMTMPPPTMAPRQPGVRAAETARPPSPTASSPSPSGPPTSAPPAGPKPNIVLVLMDDASMNLLEYMPQVEKLQENGTTFSNYYVTNSLCCPSRASLFTGRYPHNTGIYTNVAPEGGYPFFHRTNQEDGTFATDLQDAGYRTALMGKYLNGYQVGTREKPGPVPKGWDEWVVGGMAAYTGFDYKLNENGKVRRYGDDAKDYLTDVLARRGTAFIKKAVQKDTPFLLELATYAPHSPYTPAPRHDWTFPGLKAPRSAAYDTVSQDAPAWQAARRPLSQKTQKSMDRKFRKRVQSVQAIDDLIADVRAELVRQGVADNTYLILSSDNGFHLGEHRLRSGKRTAFDTDIRTPLLVVGPGVPAGRTVDKLAANVDLRPTFAALAGAKAPAAVDGSDLSAVFHGGPAARPRDVVLIEYRSEETDPDDPDRQTPASGNPPTYQALRGENWLYVEYATGEREYYDTLADPEQLNNVVSRQSADRLALLHTTLLEMRLCAGAEDCGRAQQF
jgi:N-acetylglucosamine-6-sulfatase